MTVKGGNARWFSADAETLVLARLSLALASRVQGELETIEMQERAATKCPKLSAHCNRREGRSIPARRGEGRIAGGPLSLAQRHNAGRVSMRGGK